jgi:DNA-binding CsgD family transcriptional regulator
MTEARLREARECYQQRAWSEAYRLLLLSDRTIPLRAEDLERLATSAYLIGRELDFQRFMERAFHAREQEGNRAAAARCAFWLSLTLLLRGQTGQANGWLTRAQRLVVGHECVEHGYLLLPIAEKQLDERNPNAAFATASAAAAIGDRVRDPDLSACARHLQGRAAIQQGDVPNALRLLDETMVAVSAGELSPIVTGLIYCSVIDACQRVFASGRAREWTFALGRWCEQQPEMLAFTGTCLVHRAAIMQFEGAWANALAEACRACEGAAVSAGQKPPAAAFYRQAEIHRLRGEFEAAEAAYRHASLLGMEPQPGLALLRSAQGRVDASKAALRRVLTTAADPLDRATFLPAYADIALAAGDLTEARSAAEELEQIAERYTTEVLQAHGAHVRGAVELADRQAEAALASLRRALELWEHLGAVYETARVRLLIALACRALADTESASLEFDAARASFERLGAAPDVARLDALVKHATSGGQHGLTPRELDVLRRIAVGKTNKVIAKELSLSERTIDRHVSNILTKLGVPSRAAATAYGYSHKLL